MDYKQSDKVPPKFLAWWNENWPDLCPTHQALHAYLEGMREARSVPAPTKVQLEGYENSLRLIREKLGLPEDSQDILESIGRLQASSVPADSPKPPQSDEISTLEVCRRQLGNILYCCNQDPPILVDSIRVYAETALKRLAQEGVDSPKPLDEEAERKAFEANYRKRWGTKQQRADAHLLMDDYEQYQSREVWHEWRGWLARARQAKEEKK